MKRIKTVLLGLPLFLFAALQTAAGQDLSQFKALGDPCMYPEVGIDLDDKDAVWQYILDTYGR